jgi:linoleoyl-CoA desaturase
MSKRPRVTFAGKDKNIFFSTLKKRVDRHFSENHKSVHANAHMVVKSLIMLSLYIIPYLVLIVYTPDFWPALALWFLMGFGVAGIGMSVMHDANHGAYSSSKTVNKILSVTLNLVGGSRHNWRLQHNILHHTYTNITHMDDDIGDTSVRDFSLRFSPHTPVRWYHKFQPLYAFFFYGIMTLYWVTAKDFVLLVTYTRDGINPKNTNQNIGILLGLIVMKGCYFFMMLGLPVIMGMSFLTVATGFLLMHFVTGIILTTVFQLAHAVDETKFPVPDERGKIQNAWAIHQMETTMNFASRNKWLSWYIGGLNYQIEHHLFPSICHVHLPEIAPIVREVAQEFGIPYNELPTIRHALRSHLRHMIHIGKLPHLNDGIG